VAEITPGQERLIRAWQGLARSAIHAPINHSAQAPTITTENHLPYNPSAENFSVAVQRFAVWQQTGFGEFVKCKDGKLLKRELARLYSTKSN
jgi:hypothetical protein